MVGLAFRVMPARPVYAYRQFVSTDAAVADPQAVEIELGFLTLARSGRGTTYGVPGLRLNYGVVSGMEVAGEFLVEEAWGDRAQIVDPRYPSRQGFSRAADDWSVTMSVTFSWSPFVSAPQ